MDKSKIASNFIWRFMERTLAQGISFLVSLVLARLLVPSVYGMVALVNVIINVLQVFVDSGLGVSLIQKKDADDIDFSTVFFTNIFLCSVIYCGLFFLSPVIAKCLGYLELTPVIRVIGVTILISGLKNIQQAYVSKNLMFKKFFFSTLLGTVVSAIVGIIFAYQGLGVWALVAQSLTNTIVDTTVLWITVPWRPVLQFSIHRFRTLAVYGSKILGANLISVIYCNSRQFLVGIRYTSADLAFYNKGNEFPNKIIPNIEAAISNVLLPVISTEQESRIKVYNMVRKSLSLLICVISPILFGLASVADILVPVLLTENWNGVIVFVKIFSIEALIWPMSSLLNNTINALGRSDLTLKLQLITRVVGILSLLLFINWGPLAIAFCALGNSILEFFIVTGICKNLFGYGFREVISDIVRPISISVIMAMIVAVLGHYMGDGIFTLCVQVIVGAAIYIIASFIGNRQSFDYMMSLLKKNRKE